MLEIYNKKILSEAALALAEKLSDQWVVEPLFNDNPTGIDAYLRIAAPGSQSVLLSVEVKKSLQPSGVLKLKERTSHLQFAQQVIFISPYLSLSTRQKLREFGYGYLDLTGNIWIRIDSPAICIQTEGAETNPSAEDRALKSLKGSKAGFIVREITESLQVNGVRELAKKLSINPSYVSRVYAFLKEEALIQEILPQKQSETGTSLNRRAHLSIDWPAVIRRWGHDSPLSKRGQSHEYIEPRGIKATVAQLPNISQKYAVTGSYAAANIAPIAPSRLLHIYVENAAEAAKQLGIRKTESGANVVLIEPETQLPFLRSQQRDGIIFAAFSQVAADLLSSPGRGPAEAEELINWMKNHEEQWRG